MVGGGLKQRAGPPTSRSGEPPEEDAIHPHQGRPGPTTITWLLVAAMAAGAAVAWVHLPGRHPSPASSVPMWAVAALFLTAQQCTATVTLRRQSVSFGLGGFAVVVGAALLPGREIVAVMTAAELVDLASFALRLKRRSVVKNSFNLAKFALDASLTVLAYAAVTGGASPVSTRGFLAVAAAAAVYSTADTAMLAAVMAIHGALDLRRIRVFLLSLSVAPPITLVLALLGVAVAATSSWALALVGLVALGLSAVLAAYNKLAGRYDNLGVLYDFAQELAGLSEEREVLEAVLQGLLHAMSCDAATLLVGRGDEVVRYVARQDAAVEATSLRAWPALAARARSSSAPVLLRRGSRGADEAALAEVGLQEALAVALDDHDHHLVLVVGDRLDNVSSLDRADVELMVTLSAHAVVALRGSRLLDQLRTEASSRAHEAVHDPLTSLGNRTLLIDRADAALGDPRRRVALLLLDLDRFKEINDTLGHEVGDRVLQEVGGRLARCTARWGVPTRLGGDEFAVLVPDAGNATRAAELARSVVEAVSEPVALDQLSLAVRGSVGVALSPDHGTHVSELLKHADIAMYAAKSAGGGVACYDPARNAHSTRRLLLAGDLRQAVGTDALAVHYQPKVEIASGDVVGFEALLRWRHPAHGSVSPLEFIPVAEQAGVIDELTWLVLGQALDQQRRWVAAGWDLSVAVNVSPKSLLDAALPRRLAALLAARGTPADRLVLEVTETTVMADGDRAAAVLREVSELGVRISIDDFGTGYSSLSRLRELPVHEIKVDRSFVATMVESADNRAIVASTIDLAVSLGRTVTAEGMEDRQTWEALRQLGCQYAQGFYVARPMAADRTLHWLRSQTATAEVIHRLRLA